MINLPRIIKRIIVIILDICLCIISTWIAFYLRIGEFLNFSDLIIFPSFISIFLMVPIFFVSGLYNIIFRYFNWLSIKDVIYALSIYSLLYFTIVMVIGVKDTPRTISVIQPILLFFFIVSSRLFASFYISGDFLNIKKKNSHPKALIYGAGQAGRQLYQTISNSTNFEIVGYIDDNTKLHSQVLNGVKIYSIYRLDYLIKKKKISLIFLAIPSISRKRRNEIIDYFSVHNLAVREIPNINDIAEGKYRGNDFLELDINDLLGRKLVDPDFNLFNKAIFNKVILITGAGGSIGSELSRQIINFKPKLLLLIDKSEYNLYEIHSQLLSIKESTSKLSDIQIIPLIGSINNKKFISKVFSSWKINIIYHAAAYKHVPLVEYNVINSLENNIFGTLILAQESLKNNVEKFIFISTDKAVRPMNLMGASKRLAEICLQSLNAYNTNQTLFAIVRFGNVLKSSGSVIPKFNNQIIRGGPVTVTHPKINRYFMTLTEASQLVIQAGVMTSGGEVFVLDMGEPVLIYDLAVRMIKLSGMTVKDSNSNPNGDIEIKIIGLRPGEKLYEELLIGNNPIDTEHKKIKKANESFINWEILEAQLDKLKEYIIDNNTPEAISLLKKLVGEFNYSNKIMDYIYNQQKNKLL